MKVMIASILMVALSAVAGNQQNGGSGSSLDDLIRACKHFESNPQINDFNAEITCRGFKTYWKETPEADYSKKLKTRIQIRSKVTMKGDRFRTRDHKKNLNGDNAEATCHISKEYKQEYLPSTHTLESCADIEELRRVGQAKYCMEKLATASFKDDVGIATGRTYDTCK